jgi:hypothetical protein
MADHSISRLIFGIYPGGFAGSSDGSNPAGPPDDPVRIHEALSRLQVGDPPFLVRGYLHYTGPLSPVKVGLPETPKAVEQYIREGRKLDLVLCFRQPVLDGWFAFIREAIQRYSTMLATLQITEEANVTTTPEVDGCIPQVREALVKGVLVAKEEVRRQGLDIQVGFNAAPSFDPSNEFWSSIGTLGGPSFLDALDYVGFDFFPDVFRPVAPDGAPGDLRRSVIAVLTHFRQVNMAAANIPFSVPIHITENGWPTGPTRPAERQADVLETVIRIIYEHRNQFNITHYECFSLRDADSPNPGLFCQFGLLRDDYTPKPAFERYRQLIVELGKETPR